MDSFFVIVDDRIVPIPTVKKIEDYVELIDNNPYIYSKSTEVFDTWEPFDFVLTVGSDLSELLYYIS